MVVASGAPNKKSADMVDRLVEARVDEIVDAVGLTTKSRSYLDLPRIIDPTAPAEAAWYGMAKEIGPVYYHNGAYFSLIISRSESGKQYRLTQCKIGDGDLKRILGKDIVQLVQQFILKHRRFDATPNLFPKQYVYEDNGQIRWNLTDNWREEIFKPSTTIDFTTGEVNLYLPFEAPEAENNDEMDRLLQIVIGNDIDVTTYKNWLAQLCFENRTEIGGRASLILYGVRGSGKGFLIECFTHAFIPYMSSPVPSDFQQFNEYLKNKLVYLDEQEQDALDLRKVYVFAKRISGGKLDMVGGKYKDKIKTTTSSYFACMSNGKPMHMQEIPTGERDNQWIVFRFPNELNSNPQFIQFKEKHGENLLPFIRASVGRYMLDVLHPIYLRLNENRKNYRYGLPVPITEATRELFAMSETTNDASFFGMLEELEATDRMNFANMIERLRLQPFMLNHYDKYLEDGFVSNKLIEMYRMRGMADLTPNKIQEILKKAQITPSAKSATIIKINGIATRGYYIDRDKYHALMERKMNGEDTEVDFDPENL